MPTASGRARAAQARRTHEYMRDHVIPALEPAYAQLQAAGKVPAYMTCTDAVYAHIRFMSESYFGNPLWSLSNTPAPDPAQDMCRALSDGRSADLMRMFDDAMTLLLPRENDRVAKSAADWNLFTTHIRDPFRDEFLHAQSQGYVSGGIDFATYWAGLTADNGFYHSPVDQQGKPVSFKMPKLIEAYHSGSQQLLVQEIYTIMQRETSRNSSHYAVQANTITQIRNAAEQIHAARTPQGLQQHQDDLATIHSARETIRKLQEPTVFNRLRDAFDKNGAIDRALRAAAPAVRRILQLSDEATMVIANLDTVIDNAERFAKTETLICNTAAYGWRKLMSIYDETAVPNADDLITAANRDYTQRSFPPFEDYLKERPQMKMVARIDISKLSAGRADTTRVAPLNIKDVKPA